MVVASSVRLILKTARSTATLASHDEGVLVVVAQHSAARGKDLLSLGDGAVVVADLLALLQ